MGGPCEVKRARHALPQQEISKSHVRGSLDTMTRDTLSARKGEPKIETYVGPWTSLETKFWDFDPLLKNLFKLSSMKVRKSPKKYNSLSEAYI